VADNASVIRELYEALDRHDGETMARQYAPDARFKDPAFGELSGTEAGDMWRMLLARAQDLAVTLEEASGDDQGGEARWTARYTFTRTGRPVVNRVHGLFAFRDGLIARHHDSFPLWRWASQALGPAGTLLGWSPPLRWKVRKDAARALERFRAPR